MTRNVDPRTKYPKPPFPKQSQGEQPGLTEPMAPVPDHGEDTYRGCGRLEGMRALITGGDSGIGRAVAIAYAREGADVAITYLPEEEEDAKALRETLAESGKKVLGIACDLREESACVEAVARTVDAFGGLDILVLNAATQTEREPNAQISREDIMEVFETNLIAPLIMMREAAPCLDPGSSVIVTASIQAANPSPGLLDYAMTKAALVAFTKALAEEQGERGVRVNAVAPGPIWTPLIPATGWDDHVQDFGADTPLGRPGQPAELAGAYVYLASEDASYVSGAVLPVTGGRHL